MEAVAILAFKLTLGLRVIGDRDTCVEAFDGKVLSIYELFPSSFDLYQSHRDTKAVPFSEIPP